MKPAATKKTARDDVENDLTLLQQLLAQQPNKLASTATSSETVAQSAQTKK